MEKLIKGEKEARNSCGRAMIHSNGHLGNVHGAGRPKIAVPGEVMRAVSKWSGAYLPGYCLADLEKALEIVSRHPDHASRGYSAAKNAHQRLQLEINRQRAAPALTI